MKRWTSIEELGSTLTGSVVAVGNFDGVHLGHQELFRKLLQKAQEDRLPSVVVTFDPHPAVVLGYQVPHLLTTPLQRLERLEKMGLEHGVIQEFTSEFSQVTARDFVADMLVANLKVRSLFVGSTTHIGCGREGTPGRLRDFAEEFGFATVSMPVVEKEGEAISSSRIRQCLGQGDIALANTLLGRRYSTKGQIVKGEAKGRSLGFPTANLGPVDTVLPRPGVYATLVEANGKDYVGATNVGVRPTVSEEARIVVETHLLEFQGDLLGKTVKIQWLTRLRDERKFSGLKELTRQISLDCQVAQRAAISAGN